MTSRPRSARWRPARNCAATIRATIPAAAASMSAARLAARRHIHRVCGAGWPDRSDLSFSARRRGFRGGAVRNRRQHPPVAGDHRDLDRQTVPLSTARSGLAARTDSGHAGAFAAAPDPGPHRGHVGQPAARCTCRCCLYHQRAGSRVRIAADPRHIRYGADRSAANNSAAPFSLLRMDGAEATEVSGRSFASPAELADYGVQLIRAGAAERLVMSIGSQGTVGLSANRTVLLPAAKA
jgi:hypothetical protein